MYLYLPTLNFLKPRILFQMLGLYAFQLLNGNGDMLDMIHALDPGSRPNWSTMSKEEVWSFIAQTGHCSALIKVCKLFLLYMYI